MSLRDGPFVDLKTPLIWTASIAVIIAGVLAVAVLIGDRRQTLQSEAYSATKTAMDTVRRPRGRGDGRAGALDRRGAERGAQLLLRRLPE